MEEKISKEELKYIKGTNKRYMISSNGDIFVLYTNKWGNIKKREKPLKLKPVKNNAGYLFVQIPQLKNKSSLVHRLVAEHFLPNPNNLPEINHIDENKLNNNVSNLEWCTHLYNMSYGKRNKKASESRSTTNDVNRMINWEKWIDDMIKNVNYNPLEDFRKLKPYGVIQLDLNGNTIREFENVKEASKFFGLKVSKIYQIIYCKNPKKIILKYSSEEI